MGQLLQVSLRVYKYEPSPPTASQKVSVERRVGRKEDMMTSMGWVLMVSMVLTFISTANSYTYNDRSGTSDKSDSYGTYTYDRYGKTYSHCYDREALPRDNCRNYRAGADRYRGYQDQHNRPTTSSDRDTGIYRCLATRSYESSYSYRSAYGRKETIYMEIDFTPRDRSYGGSRNEYSGYFSSRDDYRPRPYSNRDYGWFRSGVKVSEDTIVIEPKGEKIEKEK